MTHFRFHFVRALATFASLAVICVSVIATGWCDAFAPKWCAIQLVFLSIFFSAVSALSFFITITGWHEKYRAKFAKQDAVSWAAEIAIRKMCRDEIAIAKSTNEVPHA